MKKIVVGIDFSKTSVLAFRYAINIARQTQSDILLVNVQKHLDYEVPLTAQEKKWPRDVVEQFEGLLNEYRQEVPEGIEYMVREGSVQEEISNQAKYSNAWLIVIGAHGLSGFEEYWAGTDSYRVVATARVPVVTVRKGYDVNRPLKKIVIPIDSTFETVQKVPFTLDLAKTFGAQVHILSLYHSTLADVTEKVDASTHDAMRQVEFANLDMVIENAEAENITTAAIDYAKKVDADLISILTEQEFAPRNVFLGPYAQQMVNRSPVPVLSMHAKVLTREDNLE